MRVNGRNSVNIDHNVIEQPKYILTQSELLMPMIDIPEKKNGKKMNIGSLRKSNNFRKESVQQIYVPFLNERTSLGKLIKNDGITSSQFQIKPLNRDNSLNFGVKNYSISQTAHSIQKNLTRLSINSDEIRGGEGLRENPDMLIDEREQADDLSVFLKSKFRLNAENKSNLLTRQQSNF